LCNIEVKDQQNFHCIIVSSYTSYGLGYLSTTQILIPYDSAAKLSYLL